jgi:hypothetical protein
MELFDNIKDLAASLKGTASDVTQIRADWKATQAIFYGDSGNVAVQQARGPAVTAQAQGNVLTASQWNADSIAKAISGGGGNAGLLIVAAVLIGALVLVKH